MVVPGVEREPAPVEEHLEPGAKIHRRRIGGNTDVAQVSGAIAGGDVHAPAQGHREVGKIPADSDPFRVAFRRGAVAPGVMITELDPLVGIVANGLYPLPAAPSAAEQ